MRCALDARDQEHGGKEGRIAVDAMNDDQRRHLRAGFDLAAEANLIILATQSSTRALGEARGADFLARVRRRLESLGWPQLTATFVAYLTIGQRLR